MRIPNLGVTKGHMPCFDYRPCPPTAALRMAVDAVCVIVADPEHHAPWSDTAICRLREESLLTLEDHTYPMIFGQVKTRFLGMLQRLH